MPRVSGVCQDIDLSLVIPLMIHGDGADSHRRRSFMITTVGSVVTQGSMWDTRFVCYVFDETRAAEDSLATLDTRVCWSLLEAQLGHYLDLDPFGRPYAPYKDHGRRGLIMGRYRAVLAIHKGDEKYLQNIPKQQLSCLSQHLHGVQSFFGDWTIAVHAARCNRTSPANPHGYPNVHRRNCRSAYVGAVAWLGHPGAMPRLVTCG